MKTIITHAANFHADDVFAVATLELLLEKRGEKKTKVIRTLEPERYKDADYIVDIGGVYSVKKNRFDHHQAGGAGVRKNGVPYASFGLVWKTYGKEIAGNAFALDWIDRHMVQAIDAMDNGMYLYTPVHDDVHPFLFEDYIFAVCGNVKDEYEKSGGKGDEKKLMKQFDAEFMQMVKVAKEALTVFIKSANNKEGVFKQAKKVYTKAKDKRLIIADQYIPTQFSEFKAPEYIEPLVFAYPDLRGGWSAKVIRVGGQTYESRISFPSAWRGKRGVELEEITGIKGAKFCHNSGFLLVGESKGVLVELLRLAWKELKLSPFVL